eukprot:CAMPEP_0197658360 /NCGR_PEP_ID=MMETSP1338-20131121/45194_1 /TAXON_ID=43686 ORGANISM="Pelagodinium beii, Strain RCC1491" /NCGR_SAMPLE_ID=MMETSP1338 /ASSEMBLY_ACC=CAM_ASM_000754 /LENGTH=277 /DNA_ID=CAMNT_0043234937 /DNA_START=68 /DNA_END=898 /DNA_ORIENTATION=-
MRGAILSICFTAAIAIHVDVDASGHASLLRSEKAQAKGFESLTTQYFIWDLAKIPSTCTYSFSNLGDLQPDECCTAGDGVTVDPILDMTLEGVPYNCYATPAGGGLYVRNFAKCIHGVPTMAEACTPPGLSIGSGYPMSKEKADTEYQNASDPSECGCGNGVFLGKGMPYTGSGCHAAIDPYKINQFSNKSTAGLKTVYFMKIGGTCADIPTVAEVKKGIEDFEKGVKQEVEDVHKHIDEGMADFKKGTQDWNMSPGAAGAGVGAAVGSVIGAGVGA